MAKSRSMAGGVAGVSLQTPKGKAKKWPGPKKIAPVSHVGQRVAPSGARPEGGREHLATPSVIEKLLHRLRGASDGVSNPGGGVGKK